MEPVLFGFAISTVNVLWVLVIGLVAYVLAIKVIGLDAIIDGRQEVYVRLSGDCKTAKLPKLAEITAAVAAISIKKSIRLTRNLVNGINDEADLLKHFDDNYHEWQTPMRLKLLEDRKKLLPKIVESKEARAEIRVLLAEHDAELKERAKALKT